MRFAFIAKNEGLLPINRLCQIMDVSPRGYRAWRTRPMSETQRADMVVLAHIREQFALSLGSYGRPRMAEELRELGLAVGERKVGRLMRENAIAVKRNKKFKATTDSNHSFNIAPYAWAVAPCPRRGGGYWFGNSRCRGCISTC